MASSGLMMKKIKSADDDKWSHFLADDPACQRWCKHHSSAAAWSTSFSHPSRGSRPGGAPPLVAFIPSTCQARPITPIDPWRDFHGHLLGLHVQSTSTNDYSMRQDFRNTTKQYKSKKKRGHSRQYWPGSCKRGRSLDTSKP